MCTNSGVIKPSFSAWHTVQYVIFIFNTIHVYYLYLRTACSYMLGWAQVAAWPTVDTLGHSGKVHEKWCHVIIIMGQAVLKPGIRFPRGTIDWDAGTYTEWGGKVVRSVDSKTADLLREKKSNTFTTQNQKTRPISNTCLHTEAEKTTAKCWNRAWCNLYCKLQPKTLKVVPKKQTQCWNEVQMVLSPNVPLI